MATIDQRQDIDDSYAFEMVIRQYLEQDQGPVESFKIRDRKTRVGLVDLE
jgi:hypothetical protein